MKYEILVIIVALIILVISLIVVFFNLPNNNKSFPRSFTNCPDYWEMNPVTGNCIIPSADKKQANVGNLHGTPIYIYNFGNQMALASFPAYIDGDSTLVKGTPYIQDGYQVYAYNYNYESNSAKYEIPSFAYYTMINNSAEEQENLLKNIMFSGNEINFNSPLWSQYDDGGSSICQIKNWADNHNISWDGLSQFHKCNK